MCSMCSVLKEIETIDKKGEFKVFMQFRAYEHMEMNEQVFELLQAAIKTDHVNAALAIIKHYRDRNVEVPTNDDGRDPDDE